jgi:hypothetical protein
LLRGAEGKGLLPGIDPVFKEAGVGEPPQNVNTVVLVGIRYRRVKRIIKRQEFPTECKEGVVVSYDSWQRRFTPSGSATTQAL